MKKLITVFFLLIGMVSLGQQLEAYYDMKKYILPGDQPYVDVYLSFNGSSVLYDSSGFANVEATLVLKSGNHIIDFRKSKIQSPANNQELKRDFLNVERFSLKNGKYNLEVYLKDLNKNIADTTKFNDPFELFFSGNKVEYSDIELVERFEKSEISNKGAVDLYSKAGYQVYPYVSNYYPESINTISFYAEVYNTNLKFGEGEKYVSVFQITDEGRNVIESYRKVSVQKGNEVNVILNQFDIEKLYSGTYLIDLEIRNAENELVTNKSMRFYRNKMPPLSNYTLVDSVIQSDMVFTQLIIDRDTLIDYIKSTRPRAELSERRIIDNQIQNASTDELQNFMYTFWKKRNPTDPETAWNNYNALVQIVNDLYGTQIKKGYETDRGRVYLQYGKPNKLVDVPSEPNAYPYQIWFYYKIGEFSNRRFVFYNRDLSSNDYALLHSDMNGEIFNSQWDLDLHSRTNAINSVDQINSVDGVGSQAKSYYNDPR